MKTPFTVIPSVILLVLTFGCRDKESITKPEDLKIQMEAEEQILLDINPDFDLDSVESGEVKMSLSGDGSALRLVPPDEVKWYTVTLKVPQKVLNLSDYLYLALDVEYVGYESLTGANFGCLVYSSEANRKTDFVRYLTRVESGGKRECRIPLRRKLPAAFSSKLFGMVGYPGGLGKESGIDPDIINRIDLWVQVSGPGSNTLFEVSNIRAGGSYSPPNWIAMDESEFFPMIDEFGQFIDEDWPDKVESLEDLTVRREEEEKDLGEHPGPSGWTSFGGWEAGPLFEKTGHFRVEKHQGKWWLVDPEGRLFWSHGIDCVGRFNRTPVTDREYLYRDLPDEQTVFGQFYHQASRPARRDYYRNKETWLEYDFNKANVFRKYGQNWKWISADISHRRLRSWGMNTLGNWSNEDVYLLRETPYVVSIDFNAKGLVGNSGSGIWFWDVFDPSFKAGLRDRLSVEVGRSAEDPWCIGYFVDNEINWGGEISLAMVTLISPPDQAAKQVLIKDLKSKYDTIEKLNREWGTHHASWKAMLQSQVETSRDKSHDDLAEFSTKITETYFKTCRDAIKEVAPNNLYLGCRFLPRSNPRVVSAAAKYCDVISFNWYQRDTESLLLPGGVDKPVIIGEFSFGALDRGMFNPGYQPVENQMQRSEAYKHYVMGALRDPLIVGVYWFQYCDPPTTGRSRDGSNRQFGFLDIADTPYHELIQACREVGNAMYEQRLDTKK